MCLAHLIKNRCTSSRILDVRTEPIESSDPYTHIGSYFQRVEPSRLHKHVF
jgi:hypothetical protein